MKSCFRQFVNSIILLALGVVAATAAGSAFAAWKIAVRNELESGDFARLGLIFAKTLWSKSIILELSFFLPVLALLLLLRKKINLSGLLFAPLMPALVHFRYFSDENSLLRMKELAFNSDGLFYWFVFLLTLIAGAIGARGKTRASRAISRWNLLPVAAVITSVIIVIVFFLMRSYSQTEKVKLEPAERKVKVFLIGIDGATWDVMAPMIDSGELPNFASLMRGGSYGTLKTLKPTLSPRIWTSIATGKRPCKHGIYGFFEFSLPGLSRNITDIPYRDWKKEQINNGTISKVSSTSTSRRAAALWNILGAAGRSVGLVRWHTSWPPEEVNGYSITHNAYFSLRREAWDETGKLPADVTTYPDELISELYPLFTLPSSVPREEFSNFLPLDNGLWQELQNKKQYEKGDELSILKFIYGEDRFFKRAALHMLDKFPTDFFAFYFYGTDAIQHYFWKYRKPEVFSDVDPEKLKTYGGIIENYYRFADETVGEIMQRADERTVVLVASDHGMESVRPEGSEGYRSGSHRHAPGGIFIIKGPGIEERENIEASVLDIAPT
ncbi:MAG: alkaline phosphatase family protein, partial [bacterium]